MSEMYRKLMEQNDVSMEILNMTDFRLASAQTKGIVDTILGSGDWVKLNTRIGKLLDGLDNLKEETPVPAALKKLAIGDVCPANFEDLRGCFDGVSEVIDTVMNKWHPTVLDASTYLLAEADSDNYVGVIKNSYKKIDWSIIRKLTSDFSGKHSSTKVLPGNWMIYCQLSGRRPSGLTDDNIDTCAKEIYQVKKTGGSPKLPEAWEPGTKEEMEKLLIDMDKFVKQQIIGKSNINFMEGYRKLNTLSSKSWILTLKGQWKERRIFDLIITCYLTPGKKTIRETREVFSAILDVIEASVK